MRGLYVPQFTAFTSDFAVDFKATKDHGAWLIENGVSGLVPFGTFGEGASLSLAEKQRVTQEKRCAHSNVDLQQPRRDSRILEVCRRSTD
jgi:dihydrodipicolinate synthase/N-acetylneuraminate lyase